jgi:predicted nucleotidyltransferase
MNGLEQDLMVNLQHFFKSRNVELAYLFGSRARGKVSFLSDFDFAILAPESGFEDYHRFLHDLSTVMNGSRVDVVMLKDAPVELRYRAIKEGILLYLKNRYIKVEFEGDTLSRYFDFLPVLWAQRKEILKEGKSEKRIQRYREALGKTLGMLNEIRTSKNQIV